MAHRIYPLRLWTTQDLDASGVLTSGIIDCRNSDPETLLFRVTNASGNADVKIEIRISNDGTNFNSATSQDPLVASSNTDFGAANPEEYHGLIVPFAPWIRLVGTELSGTLDNSVVDATLWMREL